MKIGMVLGSAYPEDIRITKEAAALIEAGHELYLLCARREKDPYFDKVNGIHITRIDAGKHIYETTFWDTVNSIFWHHPVFSRHMKKFIKNNALDVLHVHDLPLSNTVLKAGRKYGKKVILDMHENFPAGLATWSVHKTNPIVKLKNRLFFGYNRWFNYERRMVQKVDGIIAVVDEMKKRIEDLHQVSGDKIATITNSEPKKFLDYNTFIKSIAKPYEAYFNIVYIGGFGPHRGLETAIMAMPSIIKQIPQARLLFIGKGSVKSKLVALTSELNLESHVEFVKFQPFKNIFTFMKMASINIIPHKRNEHTDNTIPHKLFQNLMVGRPVLVSDCTPLKRIIEETKGGYIFEAENVDSFASKVFEIYNHPEEVEKKCKSAVKHSYEGKYNWDEDGKKLVEFYELL